MMPVLPQMFPTLALLEVWTTLRMSSNAWQSADHQSLD
jgi:hypothetical protein